MINSVYILSNEAGSGKSLVAIGLINLLLSKVQKVGYFKPVVSTKLKGSTDTDVVAIKEYFKLEAAYEDMCACDWSESYPQLGARQGDLLDEIIAKYKSLEKRNDFTVIEGSDYRGDGTAFEFDTNLQIAKNLSAPAILVIPGNRPIEEICNNTGAAFNKLQAEGVGVPAVFINKANADAIAAIKNGLASILPPATCLTILPEEKLLQSPTIEEIKLTLDAEIIGGSGVGDAFVENVIVGASQLPAFLQKLKDKALVVTPGDRVDILLGALQASMSGSLPKISGVLLTEGLLPGSNVLKMISSLDTGTPVLATEMDALSVIQKIELINPAITSGHLKRVTTAIALFNRNVDFIVLNQTIVTAVSGGVTPHMFQFRLVEQVKKFKARIVLPEGDDERILQAVAKLIALDLVNISLFGDARNIANTVKRLGIELDIDKVEIFNPLTDGAFENYAFQLHELRKDKQVTLEMARDLMRDPSYFATMMVYMGRADGVVSGAVNTTQQTIRPALQFVKTKPGKSVVSSVFFMCLPDRVVVFGDCAVNPDPTAEQLAEIAISSAETSMHFGIEPRVAMLSYSSGKSGRGVEVEKVRKATQIVKQKRPDLKVDGPMQYDAAVDKRVGQSKLPGSEVAGQATVFIFPDLNTGNNIYKAVQRETGALAIGPVLQDLNAPVNDLSRGCTPDDVFNTVIVTAIQSFQNKQAEAAPINVSEEVYC